jgi:hypothetical protein
MKLLTTKRSKKNIIIKILVALGVGAIIGAGLFSLTGQLLNTQDQL